MNPHSPKKAALLLLAACWSAEAHELTGDDPSHRSNEPWPPAGVLLAQAAPNRTPVGDRMVRTNRPPQATPFAAFEPKVNLRWDERYLYVESRGLPAHPMMVGITAWQQQVPLPQNYTGANAWAVPLTPVPAKSPVAIKNHFLRGAIALAVNGIPIFNPQNNRGEVSADIGELDAYGGHCGRADDYHYHAAPLHLQKAVGPGQPIAFALDGYAIYGLTEPDGSAPAGLDAFDGHTNATLGYHYHASTKYPFINGGFHGEVVEAEGQVAPQPRAQPVRSDLPPLRGAKITDFTAAADEKSFALHYLVSGQEGAVNYSTTGDGSWRFQFVNADQTTREETYRPNERSGGGSGQRPPRPGGGEPPPTRPPNELPPRSDAPRAEPPGTPASGFGMDDLKKPSPAFVLTSPVVADGGLLPIEFTGDGPGATPPLTWTGAPAGTQSFAVVMDHLAPGNEVKWYWTLWDLPASTSSLPKNVQGVGQVGTGFKGRVGYEPPHSQGPGAKTYVLTVYALSARPEVKRPASEVNREVLLAALKGKVLASASLHVVYSRGETGDAPPAERPPPQKPARPAPAKVVGPPPSSGSAARPNFLVIMGEALGWSSTSVQMDDATPESKSILARTPNLEKLAAGGARFSNFYAASPRCTPTRAAFFTGRSPAALHMTFVSEGRGGGPGESGFSETGSKLLPASILQEMPESETTVAELLQGAGYATAHFGKWHVGRVSPERHGFAESDGPNNNGGPENLENPNPKQAFEITARGVDFLERQARAGKPFYLQISHYPGRGGTDARPETYAELRQRAKSDREQRLVGSAAVTEDMDATIGQLLEKLDSLGLTERTYVIFTADHGAQGRNANAPLFQGKGTVWEGGLRVPLIVRGPGIKAGACLPAQTSTVDLLPTIAELAHVAQTLPKGLEGGSLCGLFSKPASATVKRAREEFVVHFPHYDRTEQSPASALLLGSEKLIRLYEGHQLMLFDLKKDPGEQHDLAPQRKDETAALDRKLSDYLLNVGAQMPQPNPKYIQVKN